MPSGVAVARWLFVLVLVVATVGPVAQPMPRGYGDGTSPRSSVATLAERLGIDEERSDPVDREVLVTVELKEGARLPRDRLDVQRVYTREGARLLRAYVPLSSVRDLSHDPRTAAVRIDRRRFSSSSRTAPGVATIGAAALHERGVTGQNVTVGVIDRGFRPSDPEIAGQVGAYRAFDGTDRSWLHGTAVASVVADTAPGATLHLAAVGPSTTPGEYEKAVSWLRASGADVIVDAGSYFGQPGTGNGSISSVATRAAGDAVFVTSAGNYGERHWSGVDASADGQWVRFGDRQGNPLAGGDTISGNVQVMLRWDDWPTTAADYDLYLMRVEDGRVVPVARSAAPQDGDDPPTEHIDATVREGTYYVAVRAKDAPGRHRLDLFASHELGAGVANGSLTAPGTAAGVVTVGAYENGTVPAFSSRGPVGNRTGVDLVAPDSVAVAGSPPGQGTSYAAPYAAGAAALLLSEYPSLSPAEVRGVLAASATDVGAPGPDVAAGSGLLDAERADELAAEAMAAGGTSERARYDGINETAT